MRITNHMAAGLMAAMITGAAFAQTDAPELEVATQRTPGVWVRIYDVGKPMNTIPQLVPGQTPNFSRLDRKIDFGNDDFAGLTDHFITHITGFINIDTAGEYRFRLISDDGSRLKINGNTVIDHDGLHSATASTNVIDLDAGEHPFEIWHFESSGDARLAFDWQPPGANNFRPFDEGVLTSRKGVVRVTSPGKKKILLPLQRGRPGDGLPLDEVHPSYDLTTVRPPDFRPRVGGMDFLSDGRLVVCTWDDIGGVYVLDNLNADKRSDITVKRIAAGLAEPLGLTIVNDRIFVLQKQELTELIDLNGDEIIDQYRAVASGWPVSANFHEFAFGLVHHDEHFYANLAIAIDPGGKSTKPQVPNRGSVLKIAHDGSYEIAAHGLRTPNGIGFGPFEGIYISDNQGDWVPVSKIVRLEEGAFYGSQAVLLDEADDLPVTPPVVWMPQNEIGNSPSQPVLVRTGPYQGQMLIGEVTHGGIKRIFIEKIGDTYQGALFRFSQGFEAGINRMTWGPDGALYVGGIGSTGNWQHVGTQWFGLQRLQFNSKTTFEMLAVRVKSNGLEIEFTEPLAESTGWNPGSYEIEQWYYEPTVDYGGPKLDQETLTVKSASVSDDRMRVFLEIPGLKPGHVSYLHLDHALVSESGQALWSTECWYTMNAIPQDDYGQMRTPPPAAPDPEPNTLTQAEREAGWQLLFDGETTDGWTNFRRDTIADGWQVIDDALVMTGNGGDIVTEEQYGDFEFAFEWKISEGGNSGIIYRVADVGNYVWESGPEMQVLDNAVHADSVSPLTSAGSNYALYPPKWDVTRPAGEWNEGRIIVRGNHVEHWLNGAKIVEYVLHSNEWNARVAASKFASMPNYGQFERGRIALQDHGDRVWYRNLKIRELGREEKTKETQRH